jgi:alanyl-tRNA synthetase
MNKHIDSSIKQEGAFKTDTYFTFDFNLNRKLDENELNLIENKVNEIIQKKSNICTTIKNTIEEAKGENTVGHFIEKYKTLKGKIRVVNIDGVNDEICGGTHVSMTGDIEKFMIVEYISNGTGK